MDFAATVCETKWILAAGFEPMNKEKNQRAPEDSDIWQEHMLAGWQPAGPSLTIPMMSKEFQGYLVYAMIKRERSRLVIPMDPPAAAGDVS